MTHMKLLAPTFAMSILILFVASCAVAAREEPPADGVRPACAPVPGSDRDPCERTQNSAASSDANESAYFIGRTEFTFTPEWLYRSEWGYGGFSTPQLLIRGVVVVDSARCSEVRAYNFGGGDHGLTPTDSQVALELCHIEVDVSEYLLGSGPSRLTVIVGWYPSVYKNYAEYGTVAYFNEVAAPIRDALEGREYVIELALPPDMAWGEWRMLHSWQLQKTISGTIMAISAMSILSSNESDIEDFQFPLDELVPELKAVHAEVAGEYGGRISDEPDSPMLVTDASRESLLGQLRTLGAYDAPGITPVPAPLAPIPPVEPGDLAVSPPNDAGGIPLSWTAPDSGLVTGYKVVRRVPKGEFVTVVADTGSTETTYTDTSAPMTAGVTYIYRVLALNEYGESLASNRATVELPGPDAPADFTATYRDGKVVLTWTQPGVIMPSCYRIYRRAQGEQSFEWVVNCWSAELRSWRDDDVVSGTRYIYRIVPMIGYTESGATARASVRVR